MTQPEALRLADALDAWDGKMMMPPGWRERTATELRRLHAENAALAAALASSCDEQRHQLWESGGVAGCERARVAERQRDALLEALKRAEPLLIGPILLQARAAIKKAEGEKT